MRLCFICGTAAELIKIYPLIIEAEERKLPWQLLSTGQSPINLFKQYEDFRLPSDRILHASKGIADLSTSSQALRWFVKAWFQNPRSFVPDDTNVIIVHGDTLSTLVGSRWGRRLNLPVVHIEAGLRSGKLFSPFPEEITRRMVSRRASMHMAPDDLAAENLRKMGYLEGVFSTGGNTLADAVRLILQKNPLKENTTPYVVANLHRYENLNSGWRWHFMLEVLAKVSRKRKIYFVMHPQTQHKLSKDPILREKLRGAGVVLEPRMPFTKFIQLVAQAEYVLSDGGSNQEECYYLGVPCLILRETTERAEGLHSTCLLSKFDKDLVDDFIADPSRWRRPPATPNWSPSGLVMDTLARSLTSRSELVKGLEA